MKTFLEVLCTKFSVSFGFIDSVSSRLSKSSALGKGKVFSADPVKIVRNKMRERSMMGGMRTITLKSAFDNCFSIRKVSML